MVTASLSKPDVLLLVGDGRGGPDDLRDYAAALSPAPGVLVETACMQSASPSVGEGILNAVLDCRAGRVVVMPLFVGTSAARSENLRQIVEAAQDRWRDVQVRLAQPPGTHPGIIAACHQLVLTAAESQAPADDMALLVAGRGSRDADSNAGLYQIARLVWEKFPAGMLEIAFHGLTMPDISAALRRCVQNGARRIIVLPCVLYDRQTYALIRSKAVCPDAQIAVAPPLSVHSGVIDAIRQRYYEAVSTPAGHSHGGLDVLLPPRYQGDVQVSAAPMGAADLIRDEAGRVAWDQIWGSFCDLALAGGPPHRGTLLEPPAPASVLADPQGYANVLAELARGIRMITRLPVVASAAPGWIGIQCDNEAMARWLLRAIVVENVCVRREEAVLYLPAGPDFRLEHEIKNVITVIAKTHHYWMEHANA